MGGNIRGITIQFNGDTTKLDKALRQIRNSTKDVDRELKQIDKSLKFNPKSVDLWRQKQDVLKQKIKQTEDNLKELKNMQAQMDAQNVDKQSEAYRRVQREIVETESKLKSFKNELAKIGNVKLKALSEQFKQIGKKMQDVGRTMTMKVTAPLAAIGAVGIKTFAEVDKTMQLTNSTMGNTAEQAELLDKAMRDAAANSTYSMNDASQATLNFARAGLTAEQAASALAPAMNLAAGEGGNLDTVSAGLVATINGFHGSFDEASKYADVFANACNNSALDVDSLSGAMSVAAPVFAAAGYSVQDAALYMGVMANNGIEADKAANSLKTGMARLISPSKEAATWMDKLNFSITDSDGTMKDSVQIQAELNKAFSTLSETEQIAAASAIFGKNQMAPWLALINTAPSDVNKLNESLMETGTAASMSEAMMSGFGGSLERIKSSLNVAAYSFGQALAPAVSKVASLIQQLVDWFNNLSPQMQKTIAIIGLIVAAIGPVLIIIGTLISSIGAIIGVLGMITAPMLGIAAIIATVVAAGVLLYKNWDTIKAKALEIWTAITTTWNSIKESIRNTIENIVSNVTSKFNSLKTSVENIWNTIKSAMINPIQTAKDTLLGIIDTVKSWFPINLGNIFNFKVPHINIGSKSVTVGDKTVTVPTFDVSWYARGGIFDQPTLAGIGEAGPEAVVPLDRFWDEIRNSNATTDRILTQQSQILVEILEELEKEKNFKVNGMWAGRYVNSMVRGRGW